MSTFPQLGFVLMKNQGATVGAFTSGQQRNLAPQEGAPLNPRNNNYMPALNGSGFPNKVVKGKRTPGGMIEAAVNSYDQALQLGWFDADWLSAALLSLDAQNKTNKFAFGFRDDRASALRSYDWSRIEMVQLAASAEGAPIICRFSFLSRWGDNELVSERAAWPSQTLPTNEVLPAATTYTAPTTDPSELDSVCNVDFNNVFDGVVSFSLTFARVQVYKARIDGTCYVQDIESRGFTGNLTIVQDADASNFIADAGTATIRFATDKTPTTGRFKADLKVKLDNDPYPLRPQGVGVVTRSYSLHDATNGQNPVVLTAY